tara:strand:- start:1253 stop:1459 length:207 start_codon:yes stop_codon:yes gene_type:complete
MKQLIILVLLALLVWFGKTIVELENYRYASIVGMCEQHDDPLSKQECLSNTQTRTHWGWHLAYALGAL